MQRLDRTNAHLYPPPQPRLISTTASAFNPRRFITEKTKDTSNNPKDKDSTTASGSTSAQNTAFRPFGGDASICPGRHFVTMEVLVLTALCIPNYDMKPVNAPGQELAWRVPAQVQRSLAHNVFPPGRM
jgi:cytochrome P450